MKSFEALKDSPPAQVLRFIGHQLLGGAWGDLAEKYGTGDVTRHEPTIKPVDNSLTS